MFGSERLVLKKVQKIAVQIYEIQDPEEAETVVSLGVDRIGSVIVSADAWKVPSIKDAVVVSQKGAAKHSILPLFNDVERLFCVIDFYEPDIIHFCETLVSQDGCRMVVESLVGVQSAIKARFPNLEIMRTIPVASASALVEVPTLKIADCFEAVSDCFLTDTWCGKEPVKGFIGITGQTCNWITAKNLVEFTKIPVIVAGGLCPDNVYNAIRATRPSGVDSCTGTNKQDRTGKPVRFKKDFEKVKRFVQEVRRAERDFAENEAQR